jgi:hypothetical protein
LGPKTAEVVEKMKAGHWAAEWFAKYQKFVIPAGIAGIHLPWMAITKHTIDCGL